MLKSDSPSLFSEVSNPHPSREFKLLKRDVVYIFDLIKFKRRYLEFILLINKLAYCVGPLNFGTYVPSGCNQIKETINEVDIDLKLKSTHNHQIEKQTQTRTYERQQTSLQCDY